MTSAVICGVWVSSCTSCWVEALPSQVTVAPTVAGTVEKHAGHARYDQLSVSLCLVSLKSHRSTRLNILVQYYKDNEVSDWTHTHLELIVHSIGSYLMPGRNDGSSCLWPKYKLAAWWRYFSGIMFFFLRTLFCSHTLTSSQKKNCNKTSCKVKCPLINSGNVTFWNKATFSSHWMKGTKLVRSCRYFLNFEAVV